MTEEEKRYKIRKIESYNAERIKPIPRLNSTRHRIGKSRKINFQVKGIPSIATNRKRISKVRPKLIREDTFCENKNRYFGILTFVKIPALATREFIPRFVASEKKAKTSCPANR